MTGFASYRAAETPMRVDAVEVGTELRPGATAARLGESLRLDTRDLASFFFAKWNPRLYDLLVVAAAIEFCDRGSRRPAHGWARSFDLRVAVHEPEIWAHEDVLEALADAVFFLTGDIWAFKFERRRHPEEGPKAQSLPLPPMATLIMPYSEGLDSRAVHALTARTINGGLVRVRLGSGGVDRDVLDKDRQPFARVPYRVVVPSVESSARSRGFKFAVVTAIAAVMSDLSRIVVTESGQGALGPVLVRSGHSYPDYRVHPSFSRKMEVLLQRLTGHVVRYEYPRIWHTKGETLAEAKALSDPPDFLKTRSCWQSSQHVSVSGARRQCGICAACMLRRVSMSTAAIAEPSDTYVWENLQVSDFEAGVAASFQGHTSALRQYGIAGVLHMDHLAALASSARSHRILRKVARLTADALGGLEDETLLKIEELLKRHAEEWRRFVTPLGRDSFVARYASSVSL